MKVYNEYKKMVDRCDDIAQETLDNIYDTLFGHHGAGLRVLDFKVVNKEDVSKVIKHFHRPCEPYNDIELFKIEDTSVCSDLMLYTTSIKNGLQIINSEHADYTHKYMCILKINNADKFVIGIEDDYLE